MSKSTSKVIHLKEISSPKKSFFEKQVQDVLLEIRVNGGLKKRMSPEKYKEREYSARLIIQGLYEALQSHSSSVWLGVHLHSSAYSVSNPKLINDHTSISINLIISALKRLSWVKEVKGRRDFKENKNYVSIYQASGELLEIFKLKPQTWQEFEAKPKNKLIYLRKKTPKRRDDFTNEEIPQYYEFLDIPKEYSLEVKKMEESLYAINKFLLGNCICLDLNDESLINLAKYIASPTYQPDASLNKNKRIINFSQVQLRRIFSGSMGRGGRFYGGWWQNIPNKHLPGMPPYFSGCRSAITINGVPTTEIDYKAIHPNLMYITNGLEPPDGDLYDVGITPPPNSSPKEVRDVIKGYLNALINSNTGNYKLDKKQQKKIGMTTGALKKKLLKKHPILKEILTNGEGLDYQYIDSQIAEFVMLKMLKYKIVCLPVHDSFIVPRTKSAVKKLEKAMNDACKSVIKQKLNLKDPSPYYTDMRAVWKSADDPGNLITGALNELGTANKYVPIDREATIDAFKKQKKYQEYLRNYLTQGRYGQNTT